MSVREGVESWLAIRALRRVDFDVTDLARPALPNEGGHVVVPEAGAGTESHGRWKLAKYTEAEPCCPPDRLQGSEFRHSSPPAHPGR